MLRLLNPIASFPLKLGQSPTDTGARVKVQIYTKLDSFSIGHRARGEFACTPFASSGSILENLACAGENKTKRAHVVHTTKTRCTRSWLLAQMVAKRSRLFELRSATGRGAQFVGRQGADINLSPARTCSCLQGAN